MYASHIKLLEDWFKDKSGTITAFSGGVDSTLVLYLSRLFLQDKAIGCISISPSLKRKDYQFAIDFCNEHSIKLEVVETKELIDENYFKNPNNRCYFCKSHLYDTLNKVSELYPNYTIINGTNINDLGDYRPGLEAAKENKVQAPLVDCGISKSRVRELAKYYDLPNWEKPASPCLSSRVPYGEMITFHKLKQIENAEAVINNIGINDVRVRHFGNHAKIEVPEKDITILREHYKEVEKSILALGFASCEIDLEGLVSGKMNRAIKI